LVVVDAAAAASADERADLRKRDPDPKTLALEGCRKRVRSAHKDVCPKTGEEGEGVGAVGTLLHWLTGVGVGAGEDRPAAIKGAKLPPGPAEEALRGSLAAAIGRISKGRPNMGASTAWTCRGLLIPLTS
jgi:hypothetical protein